jgi:uncharacterized protein YkwD
MVVFSVFEIRLNTSFIQSKTMSGWSKICSSDLLGKYTIYTMNKFTMMLVAIAIITVSVVSMPYSSEARNERDTRSARHTSTLGAPTYDGSIYVKQIKLKKLRRSEITNTNPSNTPPSVTMPVAKETETQPEMTPPAENTTEPVVISKETVNNDSDNVSLDAYMSVLATEIHRLTNVERERARVSSLRYDSSLAAIASGHSEDMALNNYFSHTAEDGCTLTCRINEAGYTASAWGENIAWRSSSQLPEAKDLATFFVDGWMNSDEHRRNMLSSNFTHEGVGLARIGNKVYATVNFAKPRN